MVTKILDLASPPQVLELEHGNTCRILVYFDYVGDKYSGASLYAAIGLHGATFAQKVDNFVFLAEIPSTPVKTTYQVSIDIAITTDIALGTGYDMYAKISNTPGADLYNYVDDVISIVGAAPPPQYTLTTSVSPSSAAAAVIRQPDKTLYSQDEFVTLAADCYGSWSFSYWVVDGQTIPDNGTGMIQIAMTGNRTVEAHFVLPGQYTLTIMSITPAGMATVAKDPDKAVYQAGESVKLTASCLPPYSVDKWIIGDDVYYTNPVTITMNGNYGVDLLLKTPW